MRVFRGGIDRGAGLNLHRRQLNESQRALIGAKAKPMFEDQAKVRQIASRARPGEKIGNARADLHTPIQSEPRSSEKAAETVNVSARLVDYAENKKGAARTAPGGGFHLQAAG